MKIAVHAHMHYADLMEQVAGYLRNIVLPFDLLVTITDPGARDLISSVAAYHLPHAQLTILTVPNKGRDVKALYTDIAPLINRYDIIAHIHGKKSAFNRGATAGWLEHLLGSLMGSKDIVEKIFNKFAADPRAGLIYPAIFDKLPYWASTWLSNRGWAAWLQQRLKLPELPSSYFSFPVGNMFWARTSALRPLLQLGLTDADFPPERGQNDGEIMHALERMVSIASRSIGYINYVIKPDSNNSISLVDDREAIDYSAYYDRSTDSLSKAVTRPGIKVVSFDIFDTLVFRCLTDPADIFDLMQPQVETLAGRTVDFRKLRQKADAWLRDKLMPGNDVGHAEIYQRIGEQLDLSPADTESLRLLELRLETAFTRPRPAVVAAMELARKNGKRVILVSDMYLEEDFVVSLLTGLGITTYDRLYLSSSIGRRKDNRTLFPYVLDREGIDACEMMHIGDNEHSDLQIPGDLGISFFHVMRASELFARSPLGRSGFPGRCENLSTFCRVSLGLGLTKLFNDPFPKGAGQTNGDLRSFGYFYFGPVLLAYVKWITDTAIEDEIDSLYFLSRDGEILLRIYEILREYYHQPVPRGVYLEVSRRSIGVPFIQSHEQMDKLLQSEFLGGTLAELIRVRLGIDLAEHPEIDLRSFGFNDSQTPVRLPADCAKVRRLCYELLDHCPGHFRDEQTNSIGYLRKMGFFDKGSKAIVDIGYSGTLQRILNEVPGVSPIHGYYMVLYRVIDSVLGGTAIQAKGLFGDRIEPHRKDLSIDRYSLFYEMILSSTRGPVVRYGGEPSGFAPEYAPVSPKEKEKLLKLPLIHEGILDYCRDLLGLLKDPGLIRWDDPQFLLAPFQSFLENPATEDLALLAGYSLDDDYCGQGILYWAPPDPASMTACLWKKYVPYASLWSSKGNGFTNHIEYELFYRYQEQYEVLPGWYKKLGQVFKLMQGRKRIRIVLEDVGYIRQRATRAEEIAAWYQKEFEVLPRWYKRLGKFVKKHMKK